MKVECHVECAAVCSVDSKKEQILSLPLHFTLLPLCLVHLVAELSMKPIINDLMAAK